MCLMILGTVQTSQALSLFESLLPIWLPPLFPAPIVFSLPLSSLLFIVINAPLSPLFFSSFSKYLWAFSATSHYLPLSLSIYLLLLWLQSCLAFSLFLSDHRSVCAEARGNQQTVKLLPSRAWHRFKKKENTGLFWPKHKLFLVELVSQPTIILCYI